MCDCAEETDGEAREPVRVPPERLMARAKAVEAGRPGERVPDDLWPVFFGLESGVLPWRHHLRMVECRRTALAYLAMAPAPSRSRPPTCPECRAA